MRDRFLRWLLGYDPECRIVRVKSWVPWICRGELGWPTLLIDRHGGRQTSTPIWDRARWLGLVGLHRPQPVPRPQPSTATFGGPAGNVSDRTTTA